MSSVYQHPSSIFILEDSFGIKSSYLGLIIVYTSNWITKNRNRLPKNNEFGRFFGATWLFVLWLALAGVLLIDLTPSQQRVEVGAVSQQNIRARNKLTFVSDIRTERSRERAESEVEPIFFPPDRAVIQKQTVTAEEITKYLSAVREDIYAKEDSKISQVNALQPIQFDEEVIKNILAFSDEEWAAVTSETLRVFRAQMRGEIRESDLKGILRNLPNKITATLSDEQATVVIAWARGLITTNTFLDADRTEQARKAARDEITPVESSYEAGQIVVREGDIVTGEQLEALQHLGFQLPIRTLNSVLGVCLLLFLIVVAFGLYLARIHPAHYASNRLMAFTVSFLIGMTWLARLVMPEDILWAYFLPTSVAGMLLSVLLGVDIAILVTIVLSIIVANLTQSIELVSYTLLSGIIASLLVWRVERLATFVSTGLLVGLINVGVVLAFAFQETAPNWVETTQLLAAAFLNGLASASLALAGFYVLSSALGITTFLQLMDLARPTHPLFRELLLKAPGTYHHSIVVSNLSEAAAEAIGADMLLVRVGAYYHDIGKTLNPRYFIENQTDGVNIHDTLNDPYQSAEIILGHVTEGIRLAEKHNLPQTLIDFLAQHHGTTSVAWFYHQACKLHGKENVDISHFRYEGPKPQTREAAIMMLADTVEAAARAIKPAGAEEIDKLIRKLIASKLADGQMDECELNLRDIDLIRKAFINVLQGIYHPRITYPDGKKKNAAPAQPSQPVSSSNGQKPVPAQPSGVKALTDTQTNGSGLGNKNNELIDFPKKTEPAVATAMVSKN